MINIFYFVQNYIIFKIGIYWNVINKNNSTAFIIIQRWFEVTKKIDELKTSIIKKVIIENKKRKKENGKNLKEMQDKNYFEDNNKELDKIILKLLDYPR